MSVKKSSFRVAFIITALSIQLWATPAEFRFPIRHGTPFAVGGVLVADFNQDGILDIAMPNADSQVSVVLGVGGGRFLGPVSYPGCGPASSLVANDFNGDGAPDLAVSCDSGLIVVLLGNGDGTLHDPVEFATPVFGAGFATADYDRDGNADLVVAGEVSPSKGAVAVLLGNGDGTFQEPEIYPAGSGAQWIASGDLNGDGASDLVVTHRQSKTIAVLLNNGDGTFQSPRNVNFAASVGGIVLGDLNNDGSLDLVATLGNFTVVSALNSGQGRFEPPTVLALGIYSSLIISDFNDDGLLDLALQDGINETLIFLGNGDGTTVVPATYMTGNNPVAVAAADLDGDGYPDLAVADQLALEILLNAGTALPVTLSPTTLTFAAQSVGTTSPMQAVKLTNTSASDLAISGVTASGDFLVKDQCPATVAPNGSCNLSVAFRPRHAGTRQGVLTITDSAASSPQNVRLTGTGQ